MSMGMIKLLFGIAFQTKVGKIIKKNYLKLFFYVLDLFNILISKIIFKNKNK